MVISQMLQTGRTATNHVQQTGHRKNGNSYDVGHNRDYTECPWPSLWMTLRGYERLPQRACGDICHSG